MAKSTYNAPKYNEKKYRAGLDTTYYKNAIRANTAQVNKERNAQIADAQKARKANLKQAYINRVQNQMALKNNLATAGIRGGATESSNLKLANAYGQSVSAANTDYTTSVNSINQNADRTISDYNAQMKSLAEQYRQNQANARWQAAREDYANMRSERTNEQNRKIEEENRLTDYWSNYWTNYFSGYKKKDLKKELKKARALLKTAKGNDRIKYQQRIAGIQARRGVIANK